MVAAFVVVATVATVVVAMVVVIVSMVVVAMVIVVVAMVIIVAMFSTVVMGREGTRRVGPLARLVDDEGDRAGSGTCVSVVLCVRDVVTCMRL